MNEKMTDELTILLKSQGIYISPDALRLIATHIQQQIPRSIKRIINFPLIIHAQHVDEVATVFIFARRINAREGFDWGWGLDYDDYHFKIGYHGTEKGRQLYKMISNYNVAILRSVSGVKHVKECVLENVWRNK